MKLALGLFMWFVSTHTEIVIGIVFFVALVVFLTAIKAPQP